MAAFDPARVHVTSKVPSGACPAAMGHAAAVAAAKTRRVCTSRSTKLNAWSRLRWRNARFSANARAFGSSFRSHASLNAVATTLAATSWETSVNTHASSAST